MAKLTKIVKNNSHHLLHHNVMIADAACPQRLDHDGHSSDTQPSSLKTIWTTLPRRGVIASIAALPSSRRPAPGPYPCFFLGRIPPQALGETESSAMWHRACWRHVETMGCSRVGNLCMWTPYTVSAACGRRLHDIQGPRWLCWSSTPIYSN